MENINPFLAFGWSVFVGLVFSTVGAAGGILSGVGHISIFGMHNANSVKLMNQILIFVSTLISVPTYWRQKRVIFILGFLLGLGSVAGALIGSTLSYKFLPDLKAYKPFFGLFTLLVAGKILYDAFFPKKATPTPVKNSNLRTLRIGLNRIELEFSGQRYSFHPAVPLIAGFLVAIISSALGVGGGFLLVPFMVSVMGIPMFLVPGTSAFSILITMIVSGGNYIKMGTELNLSLLSIEIIGIILGSFIGPFLSKALGEKKLRIVLAVVLLYIGVGYTVGGLIKAYLGVRII